LTRLSRLQRHTIEEVQAALTLLAWAASGWAGEAGCSDPIVACDITAFRPTEYAINETHGYVPLK
jgi:hypothetical protein